MMPFWQQVLRSWLVFLFASPVRTLVLIGIGVLVFKSDIILGLVAHIMNEVVAPLFHGLLQWFVVVALCIFVWRKATGGSPAKKKGRK